MRTPYTPPRTPHHPPPARLGRKQPKTLQKGRPGSLAVSLTLPRRLRVVCPASWHSQSWTCHGSQTKGLSEGVVVDVWLSGVIVFGLLSPQASFSCRRISFSLGVHRQGRYWLPRLLWTDRPRFVDGAGFFSKLPFRFVPYSFSASSLAYWAACFGVVIWAGRWCYWKLTNLSTPPV